MRVVGLDLGRRRIGVAVCDDGEVLATPHGVVERSGDDVADRARVAEVVAGLGAGLVVAGLPLSLDGSEGPAASWARAEAAGLAAALGVPVELHDERFTTAEAERSLVAAGTRPRHRRQVVDQAAAAVLLQSWLDGRRHRLSAAPLPKEAP